MLQPITAVGGNLRWTRSGTVWADFILTGIEYGYRPGRGQEHSEIYAQDADACTRRRGASPRNLRQPQSRGSSGTDGRRHRPRCTPAVGRRVRRHHRDIGNVPTRQAHLLAVYSSHQQRMEEPGGRGLVCRADDIDRLSRTSANIAGPRRSGQADNTGKHDRRRYSSLFPPNTGDACTDGLAPSTQPSARARPGFGRSTALRLDRHKADGGIHRRTLRRRRPIRSP